MAEAFSSAVRSSFDDGGDVGVVVGGVVVLSLFLALAVQPPSFALGGHEVEVGERLGGSVIFVETMFDASKSLNLADSGKNNC